MPHRRLPRQLATCSESHSTNYRQRFAAVSYESQTEKQANKGVLPHVDDATHDNPNYRIQPRYWVDADEVRTVLGDDIGSEWFFAWRDDGPTERTFIGCLIPKTAAGHATPLITISHEAKLAAAFVAVLSSLVVDYDARQKSNRMTFFVVEQLATLTPEALSEHRSWLGTSARDWLADRVHELFYTNVELVPFSRDLGNDLPPFRWLPERRVLLQAEIDAAVLHLYQLSRSQAEWLLDSFTVLRGFELPVRLMQASATPGHLRQLPTHSLLLTAAFG